MKKSGIVLSVIAAFLAIAALVIIIKLIKGAFALAGGVLNTVLGIIIVVAIVAIAIWMLSYASKNK